MSENSRKLNILYIGNKLSKHGITATTIEILGPGLESYYDVRYASEKRNKLLRLFDMINIVIVNKKWTDYILIDTYSTLNFYFVLSVSQIARFLHIPYIPILHGGGLPKRLKKTPKLCRFIFQHAYINVAPSGYLHAAFIDKRYKCILIPNFLHLSNYPYKPITKCQPKLLWVRSFDSTYNPQMALKVLAALSQTFPNANLCMVGPDKDGSLEACKQLAVKLNLDNQVTFTGLLSKKEWIHLSKDHDIFINTTNFDNMPVSVIEAMALGFPIVTTNVGGIPFLLEDEKEALLVEPDDAEAMAEAITRLLKEPELAKKLSQSARKKAALFDWEVVKQQWISLLK